MTKRAAQTHKWFVSMDNGSTRTGTASSEELATKAMNSCLAKIAKDLKRWPKDSVRATGHGVEAI